MSLNSLISTLNNINGISCDEIDCEDYGNEEYYVKIRFKYNLNNRINNGWQEFVGTLDDIEEQVHTFLYRRAKGFEIIDLE